MTTTPTPPTGRELCVCGHTLAAHYFNPDDFSDDGHCIRCDCPPYGFSYADSAAPEESSAPVAGDGGVFLVKRCEMETPHVEPAAIEIPKSYVERGTNPRPSAWKGR